MKQITFYLASLALLLLVQPSLAPAALLNPCLGDNKKEAKIETTFEDRFSFQQKRKLQELVDFNVRDSYKATLQYLWPELDLIEYDVVVEFREKPANQSRTGEAHCGLKDGKVTCTAWIPSYFDLQNAEQLTDVKSTLQHEAIHLAFNTLIERQWKKIKSLPTSSLFASYGIEHIVATMQDKNILAPYINKKWSNQLRAEFNLYRTLSNNKQDTSHYVTAYLTGLYLQKLYRKPNGELDEKLYRDLGEWYIMTADNWKLSLTDEERRAEWDAETKKVFGKKGIKSVADLEQKILEWVDRGYK